MASSSRTNLNVGDRAKLGEILIWPLSEDITSDDLREYFERYGNITAHMIERDVTLEPDGHGLVTFEDPRVVDRVIAHTHFIGGKHVEVKRMVKRSPSSNSKSKKIFVSDLPSTMTGNGLKRLFSQYGYIVDYKVERDPRTKDPLGFGYVVFDSEQVVDHLLSYGSRITIDGIEVDIMKAIPEEIGSYQAHFGGGSRSDRYHPYYR